MSVSQARVVDRRSALAGPSGGDPRIPSPPGLTGLSPKRSTDPSPGAAFANTPGEESRAACLHTADGYVRSRDDMCSQQPRSELFMTAPDRLAHTIDLTRSDPLRGGAGRDESALPHHLDQRHAPGHAGLP